MQRLIGASSQIIPGNLAGRDTVLRQNESIDLSCNDLCHNSYSFTLLTQWSWFGLPGPKTGLVSAGCCGRDLRRVKL